MWSLKAGEGALVLRFWLRVRGSLTLNSPEESVMVGQIFQNAIDTLTDDDKALPQVEQMLPLLQRGIAIHHSGLLPLLKELVEILFQARSSCWTLDACRGARARSLALPSPPHLFSAISFA